MWLIKVDAYGNMIWNKTFGTLGLKFGVQEILKPTQILNEVALTKPLPTASLPKKPRLKPPNTLETLKIFNFTLFHAQPKSPEKATCQKEVQKIFHVQQENMKYTVVGLA